MRHRFVLSFYCSFRTNFCVAGGKAYQEDNWSSVSIGGIEMRTTSHCVRCNLTCVNRKTLSLSKEPLATLCKFRMGSQLDVPPFNPKRRDGSLFGIHLTHRSEGNEFVGEKEISVGMLVSPTIYK